MHFDDPLNLPVEGSSVMLVGVQLTPIPVVEFVAVEIMIVPPYSFRLASVIVELSFAPAVMVRLVVLAVIVKSITLTSMTT